MNDSHRDRAWCLTHNNYSSEDLQTYQNAFKSFNYGVIGKEIGEQGTPHLQMFFYLANARTFKSIKKSFPSAHIESAKGTPQQASQYCMKDGNYEEFGTLPQSQGERVDLRQIIDLIMDGKRVDDIALEMPMMYHMYGRTLHKAEDLYMRRQYRTEMTQGIWYWGPTGVGKSHKAFENFMPSTHYNWKNDNGWNDGYTQQPIVVINDFRGHIPYNELLQMVDKWPYEVRRRGREPIPFISKTVIITSSLSPQEVYKNLAKDDKLDQLIRRFKIIELEEDLGTKV